MQLLTATTTDLAPADFLAAHSQLFAEFDENTQDSGNISYGVHADLRSFFVKTAGTANGSKAYLSHPDRVALLRNAVAISRAVSHPALVPLRNVIESPTGPLLVYDWVNGELIGTVQSRRSDPASAFARFRHLSQSRRFAALDVIFDLHDELADKGWIAADFYDSSLLYNFDTHVLHVIDVDNYHAGPCINQMGRMFGSTRFMAPEELELHACIDQRSTVFTLGRCVLEFLFGGSTNSGEFAGSLAFVELARRACQPEPEQRFANVAQFCNAWRAARRNQPSSATVSS